MKKKNAYSLFQNILNVCLGELKKIISWPIEYVKSVEVGGIVLDQISHLCTPPLQTCKLRRLVFPPKYTVF